MPGAASFKRVLDGALFIDARARRAPHGRSGWHAWDVASGYHGYRKSARRAPSVTALEWWGAASCNSPVRLGARRPTRHHTKGINGRMLAGWERAA